MQLCVSPTMDRTFCLWTHSCPIRMMQVSRKVDAAVRTAAAVSRTAAADNARAATLSRTAAVACNLQLLLLVE
jgi:hypothetical protein